MLGLGRPILMICSLPLSEHSAGLLSPLSCVVVDMLGEGAASVMPHGLERRVVVPDIPVFNRHRVGCPCCVDRSGIVMVLHGVYQDLMRGVLPYCTRVMILCPEERTKLVLATVLEDPFILSRFDMSMLSDRKHP